MLTYLSPKRKKLSKLKENAKLLKEKDIALLKLLMKAEKLDLDLKLLTRLNYPKI